MTRKSTNAIVMVHGAFCGGWAFDRLREPFEAAGYTVLTPDLRGHEAGGSGERVSGVSMIDYAADVAALCAAQDRPPVLLGHSLGGLVAQLAARRARVRAVALMAPSPPWGVAGSSLEEAITAFGVQMINPFSPGAVAPDASVMRQYSLDRMTPDEAQAIIARLRPESGRALRETLNWWLDPFMTTSIGPGPLDAPSLVLTGDRDVIHPAATGRLVADRIGAEFLRLPGMSHWTVGEPGWEDAAGAILRWLAADARIAA